MPFRRLAVPLASLTSAAAAYFVMATESSASGDHDKEDESELVIGALSQPVIKKNGRFDNPWPTWRFPSVGGLLKFMFATKDYSAIPKREALDQTLPIVPVDRALLNTPVEKGKVRVTWIGHATALVQMDNGVNALTDPVWSKRCSPSQLVGVARYREAPCEIKDLPKIHIVLVSHNHYDHLDYNSVQEIEKVHSPTWYAGSGVDEWLRRAGCARVHGMSWWEEHTHTEKSNEQSGSAGESTSDTWVASVPVQHWSKRTLLDTNETLWCGWILHAGSTRFFFAGDTGMCPVFNEIGAKYAPIDLAALPIGAYEPRCFMAPQHVNPEEAVRIHRAVGARRSIGVHWGTFKLTTEHYLEPPERLKTAAEEAGLAPDEFFVLSHGGTRTV